MVGTAANGTHGPTLRFMGYDSGGSGTYKHWVIGTPSNAVTCLDIGYASNQNNPHAGIGGYEGVTLIRATTSGNVGIGGDWGPYGNVANPSYPLHVQGTGFASSDFRAPIFYDSGDTGYYFDSASTSNINNLYVAGIELVGTTTRFNSEILGVMRATDGTVSTVPAVARLMNSGSGRVTKLLFTDNAIIDGIMCMVPVNASNSYFSFGFAGYTEQGLQVFSDGRVIATSNMRAPIFYDSNDTSYYSDPNSSGNSFYGSGTGFFGGSGGADKGIGINSGSGSGDYGRIRYYEDGTNRQTIHFFARAWQGGTLQSSSAGAINIDGANGTTFGAWNNPAMWIDQNGVSQSRGSSRAPIFYDSNDTGFYIDPNTTGVAVNAAGVVRGSYFVASNYLSTGYTQYKGYDNNNHFIVIRGSVGGNTSSPSISGHHATTFVEYAEANDSTGWFFRTSGNGNYDVVSRITRSYSYFEGSVRSPMFYDSDNTAYYFNPNGESNLQTTIIGNNAMYFRSNRNTTSDSPPLQAYSNDGGGAIMSFHRGGYYAVNFGLDSDNVMRIGGWSAGANRWQLDMSGNMTAAGNVTAYSDERLKKDWEVLPNNFIESLAQVKSGTYTRIDSEERQVGVSAQGLQEFLKEAVQTDNDGMLSVNYGGAALASAVELAKEVVDLKSKLNQQQSELDELKSLVKSLLANR
jgi:hypothetical protein